MPFDACKRADAYKPRPRIRKNGSIGGHQEIRRAIHQHNGTLEILRHQHTGTAM